MTIVDDIEHTGIASSSSVVAHTGIVPSAGYTIKNSMALTGTEYIEKVNTVAANAGDLTFATWIKINSGGISAFGAIYSAGTSSGNDEGFFYARNADELWAYNILGGIVQLFHEYIANLDDTDGWVHICVQKNTSAQAFTVELNSVALGRTVVTAFLDHQGFMGQDCPHRIGQSVNVGVNEPLYAKLADTHIVLGALYDSSYFIDGSLNPIAFTESHGTNGAHFVYENASNLGENSVGDNWTDVNSPAQSTDIPS